MSTRATIATLEGTGWRGVYSHFDGYPTGLGSVLYKVIREQFISNKGEIGVGNNGNPVNALKSFVSVYIDGHKGGWSAFPDKCYCHSPDFVMRDGVRDGTITSKDADPLYIEWVYVIDPDKKEMRIYKGSTKSKSGAVSDKVTQSNDKDGNTVYDYGHCLAKHVYVTSVDLTADTEPDWKQIEDMKAPNEY